MWVRPYFSHKNSTDLHNLLLCEHGLFMRHHTVAPPIMKSHWSKILQNVFWLAVIFSDCFTIFFFYTGRPSLVLTSDWLGRINKYVDLDSTAFCNIVNWSKSVVTLAKFLGLKCLLSSANCVMMFKSLAHAEVTFKHRSVQRNQKNPWRNLCGNLLPYRKIPSCVDSYWND